MKTNNLNANEESDFSEYLKKIDTSKLIEIIECLEDYEEVSEALVELSTRDNDKMLELGANILTRELGDKYLQGLTFGLVYGSNAKLAIGIVENKIDRMVPTVTDDGFGPTTCKSFLLSLSRRGL